MIWNDLVKVALMGTDSTNLSEETIEFLKSKGIDEEATPSRFVLEAAAYFSSLQKVSQDLQKWTKGHPSEKLENQNLSSLSPQSSQHLEILLKEEYEDGLPEFVSLMAKNKKCLAGEFLPILFDRCLTDENLWKKLKNTIGDKGNWLIQQNKNWHPLAAITFDIDWYSATGIARIKLLKSIRKTDPAQAIPLLKSTWEEDENSDKEKFLKTFQIGLSSNDEDFLEECLDNKRKEIRTVAAKLLQKIPESKLQNRIFEELKKHISLNNKTLQITLPSSISDELIRDGINPKYKFFTGGLKASRLGQMIAILSPDKLENLLDKSPKEIIHLFEKTEWKELFLMAISESALIHKNQFWAKEILRVWIVEQEMELWDQVDVFALIDLQDEMNFNALCLESIQFFKTLPEEDDAITFLLKQGDQEWQEEITFKYIGLLQKWMASESAEYWGGWQAKKILQKAAFKVDVELAPMLKKGWPIDSHVWPNWEEDVRSFFETLTFRKEMREALSE